MTTPVARLKGVSKSFGRGTAMVRALQDVDIEIHAGELTLIEGPSGSGKTTLLHILGLLQRPDEGEIRIDGRRMDGLPESRLPDERADNVALIFQGYNLLDALTAGDNVAVAGLLTAGSRRVTPVMECLDRFGLAQRARDRPGELSGGEKQRIAIARALACPGRLVLADEPTANLDWANAQEVARCLADLASQEGRAVVMVSHDSRLEPFADRIVGLLNGQISSDHRRKDGHMNDAHDMKEEPRASARAASQPPVPSGIAEQRRASARTSSSGRASERATRDRHRGARLGVWLCFIVLLVLGGVIAHRYVLPALTDSTETQVATVARPASPYVAAAPAVVEPGTQLVALRCERQGRIKAILKRAGDRIRKGEALVLLDDATPKAHVDIRRTDLQLAEANLAQLKAWDRPEIRAKAKAGVDRAQARLDRAERELRRIQTLFDRHAAPEAELNTAIEEKRLAAAALEEARQTHAMSEAGPIPEEVRVAEARVEQAEAALRMAEAELTLRTIVSPLDGHVIYRHLEPGEVVDPESPVPILSLGNLDDVRLRAEVDEADIQRVHVGQPIVAVATAFGDREFTGRVVHLEPLMGRKTIRTQRTTEQRDTKVREVIIELAPGTAPLPIDLQMTVRFLAVKTTSKASRDGIVH
ncbi:MAG: ATP-binding cassette domain-containing protein [Phycisphaerae bacterium]|nr:ATP-binding cassette domain-containing protein [Phycisphaerae bacterium]